VATIIKLKDIDEAITGLGYKNQDTLKFRLIRAIRGYYGDGDSGGGVVEAIDSEALIRTLWGSEGDESLKARRKNLSSVKSGVNADLRRLYNEGRNPQGVVIGQNNLFDMSDEAKNKTLGTIDAILREDGADVIRKMAEMLNEVDDMLSRSGSDKGTSGAGKFDRIKELVLNLSQKMGLSLNGGGGTGDAAETVNVGPADAVEIAEDVIEEIVEEVADEASDVSADDASAEIVAIDDVDVQVEIATDEIGEMEASQDQREDGTADTADGSQTASPDPARMEEVISDEIVEELAEEAAVDESETEVMVEQLDESAEAADGDLYDKAEILATLAEAAKVLENLGPDLSGSPYSEEEIREKARILSEEFERDLSVRERFYNQHIFISSGDYKTGEKNPERNQLPENTIRLQGFYIGKFPVTNALFETFVEKTGYKTTAERNGYGFVYTPCTQRTKDAVTGREMFIRKGHLTGTRVRGACWYRPNGPASSLHNKKRHPVVQVSLEDACAFASWTGKRVPTESEWEAAARTARGNTYPWGNEWAHNSCNVEKSYIGDTTPVDMYIKFANDRGVVDALGNVLEWTLDPWKIGNEGERNGTLHVVKGGSWISESPARLANRYQMDRGASSNILGFRCVAI